MKILLVAPKNPESFWTFDRILPSLNKKCVFPNLSLPTVAGITPPQHEVVLCDENVEEIDFETDADIVGLTGYVIHQKRILELAAEFRRRGKTVVVGGPFASLCPEELHGKVDVVFVDEAEYTWPQFLREYETGIWQSEYHQVEKPDMHDSPLPRFDLLKTDRYRTMTIQFARGCPFSCEFCDIIVMYGRRPRTKAVEQVMAEIREIHRLGIPNARSQGRHRHDDEQVELGGLPRRQVAGHLRRGAGRLARPAVPQPGAPPGRPQRLRFRIQRCDVPEAVDELCAQPGAVVQGSTARRSIE